MSDPAPDWRTRRSGKRNLLPRRELRTREADGYNYVPCPLCGQPLVGGGPHYVVRHGLTAKQVREQTGQATASPGYLANHPTEVVERGLVERTWSSEEIVQALQRWAHRNGSTPSAYQWRRGRADRPSVDAACRVFGSWNAALDAAGLPRNPAGQRRKPWTADRIVRSLQDWAHRHGTTPTKLQWKRRKRRPSLTTVCRVFGSWNAALDAAGLCTRRQGENAGGRWTRDEIVWALRDWAHRHGTTPAADQWQPASPNHPCTATVLRVFGSWNAALDAAGLPRNRKGLARQS